MLYAPGPVRWLRTVQDHPDALVLRADGYEHLLAVARVLAWRARRSWAAHTAWTAIPTRALLMSRTGLSETTIKTWLRWLRHRGLLAIVTLGSTRALRPATGRGRWDDGADNLASEYLLVRPVTAEAFERVESRRRDAARARARLRGIPALKAAQQPPGSPSEAQQPPRSRSLTERLTALVTRVTGAAQAPPGGPVPVDVNRPPSSVLTVGEDTPYLRTEVLRNAGARGGGAGFLDRFGTVGEWALTATPGTRQEMLQAGAALRGASALLRRLSARHLRSLLREWFTAGWSPADVLEALDRLPDGTPWTYTSPPHRLVGWLHHRLAPWRHPDGTPSTPPSALRAARRQAAHDHQLAERAAGARRQAAAATDPAGHAARARAGLAAASPQAADTINKQAARPTRLYVVKTTTSHSPAEGGA